MASLTIRGGTAAKTAASRGRRPSLGWTLLLPAIALLGAFFLTPLGFIVFYSFGYKPGLFGSISTDSLSLDRYPEALGGAFAITFRNTLEIALLATALCLLVAFPFAEWLAVHVPARHRAKLLGLTLLPMWINFLMRTIGWQITLAPEGWLSDLLQSAGLLSTPLELLDTRAAVQIGVVYNYLVFMILPIYVTLERIDPAYREASRDLGATRLGTLRQVTLPLAMPGIISGCMLVFIPLMGDYLTASVLGGARANMAGQLVASQFLLAQNWALGSASAVILVITTAMTVAVVGVAFLCAKLVAARLRHIDLTTESGGDRSAGIR